MVIIVHATVLYKGEFGHVDLSTWVFTTWLDSASRVCVPLFYMASGYLFLNLTKIKAKNIFRIILALIFYSLIVILYNYSQEKKEIHTYFIYAFEKPAMYHLWFLFRLIFFYFLMAFISTKNIEEKHGLIFLLFCFTIFNGHTYEIIELFGLQVKSMLIIKDDLLFLFLYCIAGSFVGRLEYNKKTYLYSIIVLITSILITTSLTIYKSFENNIFNAIFQNYTSPFVFAAAISLFYIMKHLTLPNKYSQTVEFISKNSLGIYGIHAVILDIIIKNKIYLFSTPSLRMISTALIVFFLSLTFSVLLGKIDKNKLVT